MQKLNMKKCTCFTGCLLLAVLLLVGCAGKNDLEISFQDRDSAAWEENSGEMQENLQESEEQNPARSTDMQEQTSARSREIQEQNPNLSTEDSSALIYVQVTGAVCRPGVYEMPMGSRVFEVVEKAGGMLDEAEPTAVNQATALTDGQMIHIYTKEEWEEIQNSRETLGTAGVSGDGDSVAGAGGSGTSTGESTVQIDDGRVNINTADKQQLCSIPGIGEARAESILTYRQEHGAFGSIEEIKNVSGIKDGLFQKIKDKIKV